MGLLYICLTPGILAWINSRHLVLLYTGSGTCIWYKCFSAIVSFSGCNRYFFGMKVLTLHQLILSTSFFLAIYYKASICSSISSSRKYPMILMLLINMGAVMSIDFDLFLRNITGFFSMMLFLYVMDFLRGGKLSFLFKFVIHFYLLRFGNVIYSTFIHEASVVRFDLVYSLHMVLVHINGRLWITRLIIIYIKHEDH